MVLLLIRAPIFGLIVTIISVVAELAFLAASLQILTYFSCRSLKNKERFLKLRSYSLQAWAITILAMLMFVSMESVISVFSDVEVEKVRSTEGCFRVTGPATKSSISTNALDGRAAYFRCTKVDGSLVTHMIGNSSTESADIACSSDAGYSYRIGDFRTMNNTAQMALHCDDIDQCAKTIVRGDMLYISIPYNRVRMNELESLDMVATNVSKFNNTLIDARVMSERLVQIYAQGIHMEGEVRRRLLLDTTRSTCEFERDGRQATEVPLWVLAMAAALWALSLALLPLSHALKRHCFFDVSDPLHWARYVRHHPQHAPPKRPLLQRVDDGSSCRIRVVASTDE